MNKSIGISRVMTNQPDGELPTNGDIRLPTVQECYTKLDQLDCSSLGHVRLVSHEAFPRVDEDLAVECVPEGVLGRMLGRLTTLRDILYAVRILRLADRETAIICNGGSLVGKLVGLLNHVLPMRRRSVVMWEAFCESDSTWKRRLIRWMVLGCDVVVVYSRRQITSHAQYLEVAEDRFLFLPYKANHSKWPPATISPGNFVFSGGNSKRDYQTLFDAVRDTQIPVIVSTTDHDVMTNVQVPSNVIVVAATEPAFARLTAGSRFSVVPIIRDTVRGAGETNVCNAMWHGKPVIVADDISAVEYVEDGVTGYAVRAGDAETLRKRIVALWANPELISSMGYNARQKVANNLTHQHFLRRLIRLAAITGQSHLRRKM